MLKDYQPEADLLTNRKPAHIAKGSCGMETHTGSSSIIAVQLILSAVIV